MTLQGYQFDKAKVTPEADAQLYSYLAQGSDNKVISGLTATVTGLNVYVASGKALVQGRLVDNGQQMQLTAQANKTGYICITIDLTQANTSTGTPGTSGYLPVNNQLRLELVDVLNQQDLNSGGLIYTFPIYSYVSTGTSVVLNKVDKSFRSIFYDSKEIAWTGKLASGSAIYTNFSKYRSLKFYGVLQNLTQFTIEIDLTTPLTANELTNRPYVGNVTIGSYSEGSLNREWKLAVGIASDKNNTFLESKYRDGAGNWTTAVGVSTFVYKIEGIY